MTAEFIARVIADIQATDEEYTEFKCSSVSTHPIPFFGDMETASVLTVGVNPSATEFEDRAWPAELSNAELADRLRRYFVSAPAPSHRWFATWSKALDHVGASYKRNAAHLDLSPRATVAMSSISNWQGFAKMVKRDARWFFELLSMREMPQAILMAGCVTKRWYIHEFIECIAPNYGYQLVGKAENSGQGRVGFLRLKGPSGEVPVFFCSVSPSGRNPQMLVERVFEHRSTIAKWIGDEAPTSRKINQVNCRAVSTTTFALGIDLGGSSIKAVAVTAESKLLGERNVPFDVNEQFDWARRIQQIVQELDAAAQASLAPQRGEGLRVRGGDADNSQIAQGAPGISTPHPGPLPVEGRGEQPARAIGISAPGFAARDGRSIAVMPGRLQGLEGLDWTEFLGVGRAVPSAPREREGFAKVEIGSHEGSAVGTPRPTTAAGFVPVLNDAHAALLGEAWIGAARGFKNVFMLTLGTGVGGAALVDGRLLKGAVGRGGHLGHVSLDIDGPRDVCNMPGSLEVMVGNCTLEQRSGGRFKTTHELVAAHLRGDKGATEVWLRSVRALGTAVASMINVLDPEAVIIGGGIARSGAALFEPLKRFVHDTEWDVGSHVKILPAQLGELAGAYGAAWNALNSCGDCRE